MSLALGESSASRATQLTILLGFCPRVDPIHPGPTLGGGTNAGLTRTSLTTKAKLLPVNSTLRRGFLEPAIPASPRRGSRRRVDGVRPGATSVRPSRRNWQRSLERHRGFAAALQSPLTDSNRRPPLYEEGPLVKGWCSYRPVMVGVAVVGGEWCSSRYRLLGEDKADWSSLRWRSSLGTVRRPGGRWRLWERRVGCG
jgi:hypothetical protein